MSREAAMETAGDAAKNADLARLIELVEGSRVEEARVLAQELAAKWPQSESVRHWRRVLEPPKVIPSSGKPGKPLKEEKTWLREHAHEYPGCWLAVHQSQLIAANPDYAKVIKQAGDAGLAHEALIYFQPAPER